jgi:hypothetical protein
MNTPIGLSGFARSGKTTAAEYLEKYYGYTRLHIAEPLRDMLRPLLVEHGISDAIDYHLETSAVDAYLTGPLKETVIPGIGVTPRQLQISLGTAWGRECVSPDLWSNLWGIRADRSTKPAMNDSVRFPNEEAAIRERHGFTILIIREAVGPAAFKSRFGKWLFDVFGLMIGVHDSERVDRLNPDFVVHNTGSIDDLHRMLDVVMSQASHNYHLKSIQTLHITPETVLR